MSGLIDLHCHWLPELDDGARTLEEGAEILKGLAGLGFKHVIATPHMRPGLFDNRQEAVLSAFEQSTRALEQETQWPHLEVSCEHYFDDVVYHRLLRGEAVPYPGHKAVLLEFYAIDFPYSVDRALANLRHHGLLPVVAHPERYRCLWKQPETLDRLVDIGVAALLDTAALVGKYGSAPQRSAQGYLERGIYHAACSDAHRPSDVAELATGMQWIRDHYGPEEVDFLFRQGPAAILRGALPE